MIGAGLEKKLPAAPRLIRERRTHRKRRLEADRFDPRCSLCKGHFHRELSQVRRILMLR